MKTALFALLTASGALASERPLVLSGPDLSSCISASVVIDPDDSSLLDLSVRSSCGVPVDVAIGFKYSDSSGVRVGETPSGEERVLRNFLPGEQARIVSVAEMGGAIVSIREIRGIPTAR